MERPQPADQPPWPEGEQPSFAPPPDAQGPLPPQQPAVYPCYRHPDRATAIGCQRCGRPICGECMRPAPVGFQCPACVASSGAQVAPNLARAQRARASRQFSDIAVTASVLGLNVAVWLAILGTGGSASRLLDAMSLHVASFCNIGDQSYLGADAAGCVARGGTFIPGLADGAWWQLLTSAFTHVDVAHIGFNMVALWFLGPQLERFLGRPRYLALYLLSALAGSASVVWLSGPTTSTLGASGAIFGLMGALLIIAWRRGGDVQNILMWLGINVAFTFFGGGSISWQGHLGGLLGGALVALLLVQDRTRPARVTWVLLGLAAAALVVASIAGVLVQSV